MTDQQDTSNGERSALGADLLIPAIGSGLAIYYLISTADMDFEAKSAGLFIGSILLTLCAIHFMRAVMAWARGTSDLGFGVLIANTLHNRQRLGLIVLVALFIATIGWTGTTLGLFLLLTLSMLVMGVREPGKLLSVAFTTSAIVYVTLIFLLNTRLPHGIVEKSIAALTGQGS